MYIDKNYVKNSFLFKKNIKETLIATLILTLPIIFQLLWQIKDQALPITDQGDLYRNAVELYFKFKIGILEGIHYIFHTSGRPVLFSAFAAPFIPLSFINENLPLIAFNTTVQGITCVSYFLIFSHKLGKIKSALFSGLIATSPYIFKLNNLFTAEILWNMFFALSLYFLLRLYKTDKVCFEYYSGISLGLSALTRPIESVVIFTPLLIIYFLFLYKEKNLQIISLLSKFLISAIAVIGSSIVNWFGLGPQIGLFLLVFINFLFIFKFNFFGKFRGFQISMKTFSSKRLYSAFFISISNVISIWLIFHFKSLFLWAYGNSFGNAAKVTDQVNLSKNLFLIIYEVFINYGLILIFSVIFFALIILLYRWREGINEKKFIFYGTLATLSALFPMTIVYSISGTSDNRRIMLGIVLLLVISLFYIGKEKVLNKILSITIWITFSLIFVFQSFSILAFTFGADRKNNLSNNEMSLGDRFNLLFKKKYNSLNKINSFLKQGSLTYNTPVSTKSHDTKIIKKLNSLGITNSKIAVFSLGMFAGNENYYQTESLRYAKYLVDPSLEFKSFWAYTLYEYHQDVIRRMKLNDFNYVLLDDFKIPYEGELTSNLKSHTFFIYEVLDLIEEKGPHKIEGLKLIDTFLIGGRKQYLFKISLNEFPKITASSTLNSKLTANGLLVEKVPAWHSSSPPVYPVEIKIEFEKEKEIKEIGFLPQIGHQERGPKSINIYSSENGQNWNKIIQNNDICSPSFNQWKYVKLENIFRSRFLKIEILSNCGTKDHVTLRGLKLK